MQTKPDPNALFAAIRKGDVAEVKRLLDAGADPNRREALVTPPRLATRDPGGKPYEGDTPLFVAVGYQAVPIVRLLLERGANPNGRSQWGKTALMEAMRADTTDIAHLLLDRGAKVDIGDERGNTALVEVSGYPDRTKHIALLLARGANPDGATGETPLQAAARLVGTENLRFLLRHRVKVNLDRNGYGTPLEIAQAESYSQEAVALLRKAGGTVAPKKPSPKPPTPSKPEPPEPTFPPRDRILTDDDHAVLNTMLTDVLAYQGNDLIFLSKEGTKLILQSTTAAPFQTYQDDELNRNVANGHAIEVTLAMRQHLAARNGAAFSLDGLKLTQPNLVLWSREAIRKTFGPLEVAPPGIRLYVTLYLPGYNPTRDRAVVRFFFGPSPHGAKGTYFLTRGASGWTVAWREFAYYA